MNISIGTTPDDPRVVDKSFSITASFSGSLKNDSGILKPTIRVTGNISSVAGCNYMHIPAFNRYYYITEINSVANNIFEISGKVDVLKSNAADIRASNGIACRNSYNYDLYLDDSNFKLHCNPKIVTKQFPGGFNYSDACYILMVAG